MIFFTIQKFLSLNKKKKKKKKMKIFELIYLLSAPDNK